MSAYLLDTNMASYAMHGHPNVRPMLAKRCSDGVWVSAITEGEIRWGLHKRGRPKDLTRRAEEFLEAMTVLPWRSEEARVYGALKATQARSGKPLADMDLLLAAHALSVDAVMVSDDEAFGLIPELRRENWLRD